tara:strand:+ start:304 stop:648 length:345 start_codon:yes stop_codon:yes gene_type:complete
MIEPSYEPCPKCNDIPLVCDLCNGEKKENVFDIRSREIEILADQAITNLKFLNLGTTLSYLMTDLEREVYHHHQVRKCTFKETSELLNKSEATLKMAWKRCKLKGDKALEESTM